MRRVQRTTIRKLEKSDSSVKPDITKDNAAANCLLPAKRRSNESDNTVRPAIKKDNAAAKVPTGRVLARGEPVVLVNRDVAAHETALLARTLRDINRSMSEDTLPGSSSHGGQTRTVVERLRNQLDSLTLDETRLLTRTVSTPVSARSSLDWLTGSPCSLDEAKCVQTSRCGPRTVQLPFAPFPAQIAVMERVIRACDQGGIALLQSPTGTGKSIALLSSALAWQRQTFADHGAAPQIIYGVRTHAQLAQMVGELRKTAYRPRMAVIGSRNQFCINEEVKANALQHKTPLNLECRKAARRAIQIEKLRSASVFGHVARGRGRHEGECACQPYARLGDVSHARRVFAACGSRGALWDVEDLVKACSSSGSHAKDEPAVRGAGVLSGSGGCPYYTSHILAGGADLVFCPHNYVLDPSVSQCRSHHRERWSLKGRVVIIDEAHNIEQACRDAGSVDISMSELRQIVDALYALLSRKHKLHMSSHGRVLSCREL